MLLANPLSNRLKKTILIDQDSAKDTIREIKEYYRKAGMCSGKKPLPFFLSAYFLHENQFRTIKQHTETMARILQKVAEAYFQKGLFHDVMGELDDPIYQYDSGYRQYNVFGRYDLFMTGDKVRFIEFNCESPSGMGRLGLIDDFFLKTPQFRELGIKPMRFNMREDLLKALIKCYRDSGGKKRKPTIAIIDWKEVKTRSDQKYLCEYFESKKHKCIMCDPRTLKYNDGKRYHGKYEIDIIYKRVISSELAKKGNNDLFRALQEKAVCMANPFKSNFMNNKNILNHLSLGHFDGILSKKEIQTIQKTIPWTRDVNVENTTDLSGKRIRLSPFVLKNKDWLVLKPNADVLSEKNKGYGGIDVFIGLNTDQKSWEEVWKRAKLDQDWIVQEYVDIPEIEVPEKNCEFSNKYVNLSPYVIDGKLSGFLTRVSDSKVINTSTGGGIIPTYVVKELK
jgi:hypothetical protein